jgi:hypothetical protein
MIYQMEKEEFERLVEEAREKGRREGREALARVLLHAVRGTAQVIIPNNAPPYEQMVTTEALRLARAAGVKEAWR